MSAVEAVQRIDELCDELRDEPSGEVSGEGSGEPRGDAARGGDDDDDYVYDLTTDNAHFGGVGVGRIVAHNTDSIMVDLQHVDTPSDAWEAGKQLSLAVTSRLADADEDADAAQGRGMERVACSASARSAGQAGAGQRGMTRMRRKSPIALRVMRRGARLLSNTCT